MQSSNFGIREHTGESEGCCVSEVQLERPVGNYCCSETRAWVCLLWVFYFLFCKGLSVPAVFKVFVSGWANEKIFIIISLGLKMQKSRSARGRRLGPHSQL